MRVTALVLIILISVSTTLFAQASQPAAAEYHFNVKAQAIEHALSDLADQAGYQLLFSYETVESQISNPVIGRYTLKKALAILLKGTSLSGRLTDYEVIVITSSQQDSNRGDKTMNTRKTLLASTIAFFIGGNATSVIGQEAGSGQETDGGFVLEEIVVTATKRETSLQDTAMSVSALSGESIDRRNLVGMGDYLPTVPGVNMQDRGAGQNSVVIRGISSDLQEGESGVGIYYGNTPVTNLRNATGAGASGNGDLKLVDMERIEVLRGPQGTLYGSGSMSGTVRAIPYSPNLSQIEGKLSARYSQTGDEGGDNTMFEAVINMPLIEDKLAVRAVGYQFDNSGYINNVAASKPLPNITSAVAQGGVAKDQGGVGADDYTGFRVTTLWRPTEEVDVSLTYTQQDVEQDGLPEVDLDISNSEQARLGTGVGGGDAEFLTADINIVNLAASYDFEFATLSSYTSWLDYETLSVLDYSHAGFVSGEPYFNKGVSSVDVFIEEIQLVSDLDGPLQFVAGYYYEDIENSSRATLTWSGDENLAPSFGDFLDSTAVEEIEQKAFFGEISYELTKHLEATLGARHYSYKRDVLSNFFLFGDHLTVDDVNNKEESGDTYKANLSWRPNEETLVYGQWSEGFRLGRVQPARDFCDSVINSTGQPGKDGLLDDVGFPVPDGIDSDTTENFEIGVKTSTSDNRISISTAIYHTNWDGIPVGFSLPSCNASVILNAGKSKAQGIEVEILGRLTEQVSLNMSTSYGEATLKEDAPDIGESGDNLPGSPDFQFSAGLEYSFDFSGYPAFARVDYAYVSEYFFRTTVLPDDQPAGDYGQVHFKTGINLNQVNLDFFIQNLTNADDTTWVEEVNNRFNGTSRIYRLRPRTVGLNISYLF